MAVRIIESKNTEESNPALCLSLISSNIWVKKLWLSCGSNSSIKLNNTASKFSIGINAIKFRINNKKGKSAIKKLKAILPALDDKVPFMIPDKYNSNKS